MSKVRLKLGRLRCGISSKIKMLFNECKKTKPVIVTRVKVGMK